MVVRSEGIVLVDAGLDGKGKDMLRGLAAIGRPVEDVRAILLTHWHNDHSSGAAKIRELSGARIYYHPDGDAKFTRAAVAGGVRSWIAAKLPDSGPLSPFKGLLDLAPPHAVRADQFVREGDIVERDFKVLETPGHEKGHVSFWFEPERVLFAGDALAVAGDHVTYLSWALTNDIEAARRSMMRCLELDIAAICPGHRYPLIGPSRAHLDAIREEVSNKRWWPIFGA
jgi:glyoxylase-like metal-dependent hydrolase (beta-lactamase superfamily II)